MKHKGATTMKTTKIDTSDAQNETCKCCGKSATSGWVYIPTPGENAGKGFNPSGLSHEHASSVLYWKGTQLHGACMAKHYEKHRHGKNASRCKEFGS
jgi:hypothetical protein